jgi:hypothetical protein
VVPPRSNRVSRAPPYSRTSWLPCPYGAVTRCGPPFQTVPVRAQKAAGLVRVRSPLLAESQPPARRPEDFMLMSFPPATEMVQFAGFASPSYGFTRRYRTGAVGCPIRRSEDPRALAPPLGFSQRATSFIASRYQGIHQMPFSPKLAHAQPQARQTRGQRTEIREQTGHCRSASIPTF